MAKMRGIKPGFFTSDSPSELSIPARFLLIGLFTLACDNGHVELRPKQIKRRLMPDDDVNCAALLREIGDSECADIDGDWLTIRGFADHQRVDPRWFITCTREGCVKPSKEAETGDSEREPLRGHARTHRASQRPRDEVEVEGEGELICEGEGEMAVSTLGSTSPAADEPAEPPTAVADAPTKAKRGTRLDPDWTPDPTWHRDRGISDSMASAQLEIFRDYWLAKSGQTATKLDWPATWRNWLRRAHGGPTATIPGPRRPNAVQQAIDVHNALKAAEESAAFVIPPELQAGQPL